MTRRQWLASYPPGMPHEVDPDRYATVGELLEESFRRNADRTFSFCLNRPTTYRLLDARSRELAAWLQAQGLAPGARVAIMLPNLPQFAVAMAAVLRAGFTCVNVNPLYTARELEHQLNDSGATAIVLLENFAHTLQEVIPRTPVRHVLVTAMGDMLGPWFGRWITFATRHLARRVPAHRLPLSGGCRVTSWPDALRAGAGMPLRTPTLGPQATAFLQYTGGTTGRSKGAVLTHRNVVAAVLQAEAWFTPAVTRTGDVHRVHLIAALPLYHIFALTLCLLAIRWGAHQTLVPNPRDIGSFIETLKQRPFHLLPGVNTLFNALLQHPQFHTLDFSQLCVTQAGGMAASARTAREWQKVTGCPMIEGWGMSETCAIGTNNPVTSREFSGTIGLPLPGVDLAIQDEEGHTLPAGVAGEICVRGPNVTPGYHDKPEDNARAFTADGYLRTGDIGVMDERGFTRIIDRKKDMILVSGFNVYPNELEGVIAMCPGVVECAVVGVPDPQQGEAVKAFVVRRDPLLTEDTLLAFCREHLAAYKIPKYVEFRDELPKTPVGKILRRELRAGH